MLDFFIQDLSAAALKTRLLEKPTSSWGMFRRKGEMLFHPSVRTPWCHCRDRCRLSVTHSIFDYVANEVCGIPGSEVAQIERSLWWIHFEKKFHGRPPQIGPPLHTSKMKYTFRASIVRPGPLCSAIVSAPKQNGHLFLEKAQPFVRIRNAAAVGRAMRQGRISFS